MNIIDIVILEENINISFLKMREIFLKILTIMIVIAKSNSNIELRVRYQ